MTGLHTENKRILLENSSVKLDEKIEALALRLFEQRLKETVGNPQEVAKWAVVNAKFFYDVVGGVE